MEPDSSSVSVPQVPLPLALPSTTDLLRQTFSFCTKYWKMLATIAALPFAFGLLQIAFMSEQPNFPYVLFSILVVVAAFFSRLAFSAAVTGDSQPELGAKAAYSRGAAFWLQFLWLGILTFLVIMGGFFLLFIPGIALALWTGFATYIFFAEGKRGLNALAQSWHYTKHYWWSTLWRFLAFGLLLWLVLMVVSAPVALLSGGSPRITAFASTAMGDFIITPLGIVYAYYLYQSLKRIKAVEGIAPDEEKTKKTLTVFAVLGIIGIVFALAFLVFFIASILPMILLQMKSGALAPFSSMFASSGISSVFGLFR
jgi:hypothetical protein